MTLEQFTKSAQIYPYLTWWGYLLVCIASLFVLAMVGSSLDGSFRKIAILKGSLLICSATVFVVYFIGYVYVKDNKIKEWKNHIATPFIQSMPSQTTTDISEITILRKNQGDDKKNLTFAVSYRFNRQVIRDEHARIIVDPSAKEVSLTYRELTKGNVHYPKGIYESVIRTPWVELEWMAGMKDYNDMPTSDNLSTKRFGKLFFTWVAAIVYLLLFLVALMAFLEEIEDERSQERYRQSRQRQLIVPPYVPPQIVTAPPSNDHTQEQKSEEEPEQTSKKGRTIRV